MAQFNRTTVMTVTSDDRAWLSFGCLPLEQMLEKLEDEYGECFENIYTGEVVEKEDIEKALWTIKSFLDAQESWGWKLT